MVEGGHHAFDDVVAAADEDAVVPGVYHLDAEDVPERRVQLQPTVGRVLALRREVQQWSLTREGGQRLAGAGCAAVAWRDRNRLSEVVRATTHENRPAGTDP